MNILLDQAACKSLCCTICNVRLYVSFAPVENNSMNWVDRAFDYWIRDENVTVVKSAGNTGGSITSPGKAWNLITVGGIDDNESSDWSDDIMAYFSSYIDPTASDREKPEVVGTI